MRAHPITRAKRQAPGSDVQSVVGDVAGLLLMRLAPRLLELDNPTRVKLPAGNAARRLSSSTSPSGGQRAHEA